MYATDIYENRKHIHVGRKGTERLCKIWLEPEVEISDTGNLSIADQKEVLEITKMYKLELILQWENFKSGKGIEIIKIN